MPLARIVHWRPSESVALIEACRSGGWKVDYHEDPTGPAISRAIRETIPDAVVIDLSRLPSHGREIGVWMRSTKRTRHIPIVFVNGDPVKVEAVRQLMPDAQYSTTPEVSAALNALGAHTVTDPVIPRPTMDRYGTKTVAEKLGIAVGSTVAAIDPPRNYPEAIGVLPEGAEVSEDPRAVKQVTLWFLHDVSGLALKLRRMRDMAARTKLWLVWKRTPGNGLGENVVREAAIGVGLVDYKICALHLNWSGILFARKKPPKNQ